MQKNSKLLLVLVVTVITGLLMVLDETHLTLSEENTATIEGTQAPDVTFALLDGGELKLHSLKGRKVMLHFWASWCLPCRKEFPELLKYAKKNDAVLVAVSADTEAADAKRFLAAFPGSLKNKNVTLAHDPQHKIIEGVFQTFQYPETIFITPNMEMQKKIAGAIHQP